VENSSFDIWNFPKGLEIAKGDTPSPQYNRCLAMLLSNLIAAQSYKTPLHCITSKAEEHRTDAVRN